MKKLIVGIGIALIMSACTTVREKTVNIVAPVIADQLECSNTQAIKDDLNGMLGGRVETKSIGGDLCTVLSGLAVDLLANHAIPESWECKAEVLPDKLKDALAKACAHL